MMWKKISNRVNWDAIMEKLEPTLSVVSLFLTTNCNLRCKMCHIWGKSGWAKKESTNYIKKSLKINEITDVMKELSCLNPKPLIILTGGEPLLYPEIKSLLQLLKKEKIRSFLLTNGVLLEKYASDIVSAIEHINVSLYGPPKIHDDICGMEGAFNKAISGIKKIQRLKDEKKVQFPSLAANFVISEYNYKYIYKFFEILIPLNIEVIFEPLLYTYESLGEKYEIEMKKYLNCEATPCWRGFVKKEIKIDPQIVEKQLHRIWAKTEEHFEQYLDISDYFGDVKNTFGYKRCLVPWYEVRIRPNGDVTFCPDLPDYIIGNIKNENLLKIFKNEKAEKLRSLLKKRLLPLCYRCCRLYLSLLLYNNVKDITENSFTN